MIKLEKALRLGNVNNLLTHIKDYIDSRVSALAQSVSSVMEDVDASINTLEADMTTKGNCEILSFSNKTVATSAWAADTTYSGYPYRASVSCDGVTASHIPDVTLSVDDAESLNFAAVAATDNGVVYIYAKAKPTATITIPTIECRKAVS